MKSLVHRFALLSAFFLPASTCLALPKPGSPAPPLRFAKLLQAPSGTRIDWLSLRGKTVVLEFWATWCGPCVASIPHLNQLSASLDPNKFVFISIDDEDSSVVEAFMHRKKMATWVALDANESTFKAFGVTSRPATIIVDKNGRIAAVTTADKLTQEGIAAIGSREPAAASKVPQPVVEPVAKVPPPDSHGPKVDPAPLFELLVRPSTRRDQGFGMMHSTDGKSWGYLGVGAKFLLSQAYSMPPRRIEFVDNEPTEVYDFFAGRADLDEETFSQMMQKAVPAALNLKVTEKSRTESLLILKASEHTRSLQTAVPSEASYITFKDGKLLISNSSFAQIAMVLEGHLNIAVLDETKLQGKYDAEISLPSDDERGIATAFVSAFGVDLAPETSEVKILQVERKIKDGRGTSAN
jgi:uncharacterized protein (TIGR03435 family)